VEVNSIDIDDAEALERLFDMEEWDVFTTYIERLTKRIQWRVTQVSSDEELQRLAAVKAQGDGARALCEDIKQMKEAFRQERNGQLGSL